MLYLTAAALTFVGAMAIMPVSLFGWTTVTANPGQSARVEVRTDGRMWRRWDAANAAWDIVGSGGRLLVARGLGDVRATLDLG